MRPFKSVARALGFYFLQAERFSSVNSIDFQPRVQGLDSRSRRADAQAVYLSVSLCLGELEPTEKEIVAKRFRQPNKRPEPSENRIYHRAMTKLGKEMRRRGVVE